MTTILNYLQLIVSILLIILILLQQRGSGLGAAFGGGGDVYLTKRGAEKTIFILTIILSAIFLALGILRLLI
ncbi:MAG TPA: preprotein translocase subunit SecG [bacterium]|nr:preprotein translocase subunit SecG [bacterium]HPL95414.1 preprotein translocase subunit SecG [bacterium]